VVWLCHDVATFSQRSRSTYELIRDFQNERAEFEADQGILSSALVNILENAVEACLEDKSKADHDVVFSMKEEGNAILFRVSDNGVGMDRETMDHMFTLFFSSKGSRGPAACSFRMKLCSSTEDPSKLNLLRAAEQSSKSPYLKGFLTQTTFLPLPLRDRACFWPTEILFRCCRNSPCIIP
jgi:hypothetical protein